MATPDERMLTLEHDRKATAEAVAVFDKAVDTQKAPPVADKDDPKDESGDTQPPEAEGKEDTSTPDMAEGDISVDPLLLRAAKRAELTEEDVADLYRTLGTEKTEAYLQKVKRNSDFYSAKLGDIGRKAQPTQAETKPVVAPDTTVTPKVEDEDEYEDVDPKLVARIKELEARNALADKREAERAAAPSPIDIAEQQLVVDTANKFFESIQEDFGDVFGKTPLTLAAPISEANPQRIALLHKANAIRMGDHATGGQMTAEGAMDLALSAIVEGAAGRKVRKTIIKQLKTRSAQTVGVPTNRRTADDAPAPDDAAEKAFDGALKDRRTE